MQRQRERTRDDAAPVFLFFLLPFLPLCQALALAVITLKWLPIPLCETTAACLLQVGACMGPFLPLHFYLHPRIRSQTLLPPLPLHPHIFPSSNDRPWGPWKSRLPAPVWWEKWCGCAYWTDSDTAGCRSGEGRGKAKGKQKRLL